MNLIILFQKNAFYSLRIIKVVKFRKTLIINLMRLYFRFLTPRKRLVLNVNHATIIVSVNYRAFLFLNQTFSWCMNIKQSKNVLIYKFYFLNHSINVKNISSGSILLSHVELLIVEIFKIPVFHDQRFEFFFRNRKITQY